jgi:hypothetical protein
MRRVARLLLGALVALVVTTGIGSSPAFASTTWGCTASGCQVGVGTPGTLGAGAGGTRTVADPTSRSSSGGGSSSGPCPPGDAASYQIQTQGGQPVTAQPGDVNPITGQPLQPGSELEVIFCDDGTNVWYLTTVVIPPGGGAPAVPRITAAQLARQAFAGFRVSAPVPVLSPSTAVVNYQTWLWIRGGWSDQSATASVPGLSATVTAAPTRVVWRMGDGGEVVCDGPGVAWSPADPAATTDCSYTYSMAGSFTATVTVFYGASWSASDGTAGQLGAVTGHATFPVTVDEIQAVNTN